MREVKDDRSIANQFRLEGLRGNIRADIVLLVNGIPLVLIEGKNPTREEVDWTDGYRQIKDYEEKTPELFKYVQFSIATDGIKTYYFPNAFNEEEKDFLNVWKDPYPYKIAEFKEDMLKIAIYGLLPKQNVLDLIENFTFIRKERDKSTKIMTRYMQFRASNRIFQRVINTLTREEDKKFGLIWHWQGARAVVLPESALKYVIVHEIAHIFTKRHTNRFWKIVKTIYPDFKVGQNLLEKYKEILSDSFDGIIR